MYATQAELEAEGWSGEDDRATLALTLASKYIDRVTGQWFEEREKTLTFDGESQKILYMPAPIVEITSVEIDAAEISTDEYTVYDREEDVRNPRIVFESEISEGRLNVEVVGTFGWLEDGATPVEIRQACLKLALREAATMTDPARGDEILRGRVVSETTDQHSITLAALANSGGPSGDPELDGILASYRKVIPPRMV